MRRLGTCIAAAMVVLALVARSGQSAQSTATPALQATIDALNIQVATLEPAATATPTARVLTRQDYLDQTGVLLAAYLGVAGDLAFVAESDAASLEGDLAGLRDELAAFVGL